jgi:outer membrane lipoprotein carrier protein
MSIRELRGPSPSRTSIPGRRAFLRGLAVVALAAAVPGGALGALTVAPGEAQAAAPTALDIAGRVQTFYNTTRTFQADFTQTYVIKVQNKKKESTGKVVFEKPGKMSFRYAQPNGNRVVSDGKVIKVYEQSNAQMYESRVEKSQYPAALSFLMGQGQLIKDFDLKLLDSATMKFEGGYVLECTPKAATPAYQKMLLYVDGPTSQVRRVLILDAQGNRNRFDFLAPVVNKPVAADEFVFTPPKGTKIVKP